MIAMSRSALLEQLVGQIDQLRTLRVRSICDKPMQREISLPQLHVLMTLHDTGPMTVSAISHLFGISVPSASSIVDRMDDHGLVTRVRDGNDRRVVTVDITDRGRVAVEEFVGLHRDQLDRLFGAMSGEDLEDFSRGLAALQRGIERAGELTRSASSEDASPAERIAARVGD
jgi:DNA-binding MarR family transcriptional regulator